MPRLSRPSGLFIVLFGVLCCTVNHAQTQRAQTTSDQGRVILAEYWTVVRRYEAGQTAPAIREMSSWPQDRITKVQATQFQPEAAPHTPTTLRAGAMLHSEVALEALRRRDLAPFLFHAGIADGWLNLADDRKAIPGGLRSRWNVAIGRVLLLNGEFGLAEQYLDRLNTKIANDPAVLLALGTVKENKAPRWRVDLTNIPRELDELRTAVASHFAGERDELRTTAAALFERALALDAGLVEARLRLARLAIDRGDTARAERELTVVAQASPGPIHMYLVNLWRGQIRELNKQWNDAAELYVEAVKTQPDGQSAYVALSHVLHTMGEPAQAAGVMERWFARGVTSPVADPWWTYPLGLDSRLELRFGAIIAEVKAAKDAR